MFEWSPHWAQDIGKGDWRPGMQAESIEEPRCQVEYKEKGIARILKLLHNSNQKFKRHNTTQVGPREDYGARLAADWVLQR